MSNRKRPDVEFLFLAWLRRTFTWSNSWSAWQERLIGVAVFLAATILLALSLTWFAPWQSVLAWSVFAVVVAVCSQQGWIRLLGPVLFYDMVRTARRSRYVMVRILYGGFLLVILFYMWLLVFMRFQEQMHRREMAVLAETFFAVFMLLQLAIVILLTPAYVAGAIAEEKDRKTLEFILATDLHSREIVLSKFLSRLGNMTLLLLTGLPIMSMLQFLGGVDAELMLAGFAAVGLTMLGIGSLSILFSTLFQKPRDSISLTYLMMLAYVSFASIAAIVAQSRINAVELPIWFGEDPPRVKSLAGPLNAGNPIMAIIDVGMAIDGRTRFGGATTLGVELPRIIGQYAWFHLGLTAVCITWSILRIRAIALKQTVSGTTAELRWWQRLRPPVGNLPMLWKEVYIEGRVKLNWLIWLAIIVLVLITLGSGIWVLGYHLSEMQRFGGRWRSLNDGMNIWFRIAGTFVSCLLLLMLGIRASTTITHERERDTFDALLTTPMSADGMLFAKLVGNITSMRISWCWLGAMLALALFTGGLHPFALPFLVGALLVYAVAITMIGLTFSILCKSSLQSATLTMLVSMLLGGAHWLITSCVCVPVFGLLAFGVNQGRDPTLTRALEKLGEYGIKFQAGVTPPVALVVFSFTWDNIDDFRHERHLLELALFSVLGLILWLIASAVAWFGLLVPAFRRLTRREEYVEEP